MAKTPGCNLSGLRTDRRCLLYLAQCQPESLDGERHVPLAWPLTRRCNGDLVPRAEVNLASLPDNWQQGKGPAGRTRAEIRGHCTLQDHSVPCRLSDYRGTTAVLAVTTPTWEFYMLNLNWFSAGFVLVKKVPGTLHFLAKSPGHSFDFVAMNMSHLVHQWFFGNKPSPRRRSVRLDACRNSWPLMGAGCACFAWPVRPATVSTSVCT